MRHERFHAVVLHAVLSGKLFRDKLRIRENLYQFTPKLNSFTYYDSLLNELDKVLPGGGDIRYRLAEYKSRYEIPQSRIDKSYRAGIRKSAEITRKHIKLPPNEEVEVKYIDNAPWNAYNWYQGNYKSLIEINNIQSIYLERIIDLSAHEAYPGHHVYYALREKKFYRDSGYIEFSIYPLFTPNTFL